MGKNFHPSIHPCTQSLSHTLWPIKRCQSPSLQGMSWTGGVNPQENMHTLCTKGEGRNQDPSPVCVNHSYTYILQTTLVDPYRSIQTCIELYTPLQTHINSQSLVDTCTALQTCLEHYRFLHTLIDTLKAHPHPLQTLDRCLQE